MGIVTGKPKVNESGYPKQDAEVLALSKKIAKLTDRNEHTVAIMELAKFLKDSDSIKLLEAIQIIHKIEGSIPQEIIKYRSKILANLMDKLGDNYGIMDYTNIHQAF